MKNCSCREDLVNLINEASFAVDDVKLYLDTHPCDREAMEYFCKYSRMRNEALKEYAENYGPLTVDTVIYSDPEKWNWTNEPWPWQEGGC